jgi:hypothetical protein
MRFCLPLHFSKLSKTIQNNTPKGKSKKLIDFNLFLKSIGCALILTASPCLFADAHFGVGLSDGDKKVTWVDSDVSVSDDIATEIDDRWNGKEVNTSDIDYETYVKSFNLYMVFKRNF